MKKILLLLAVILVIAGCNKEKIYKDDLNGIWQVYKYLQRNVDKSQQFQNQHPNYTITFTSDGKFTEFLTNPDSTYTNGSYRTTGSTLRMPVPISERCVTMMSVPSGSKPR